MKENALPAAASPLLSNTAAPRLGKPANAEAVAKAAKDFESFFLSQTFETMMSGLGADTVFGGGRSETVYRSLLTNEYAKVAAQRGGGFGVAEMVQREMLRAQEAGV